MQNLHSSARTAAKTMFKRWASLRQAKIATILMLAAGLLVSSCENENDAPQLKRPVVLIAKSKGDSLNWATITLKDADNFYWSKSAYNSSFVKSIVQTYNVGDTLK